MNGLVTSALRVNVSLDVLGWTSDENVLNETMASEIVRYVEGALRTGLERSEIEADLVGAWGSTFSNISVDVTRSFRKATALVFAVAAARLPAPTALAGTALT